MGILEALGISQGLSVNDIAEIDPNFGSRVADTEDAADEEEGKADTLTKEANSKLATASTLRNRVQRKRQATRKFRQLTKK